MMASNAPDMVQPGTGESMVCVQFIMEVKQHPAHLSKTFPHTLGAPFFVGKSKYFRAGLDDIRGLRIQAWIYGVRSEQ